MDAHHFAAISIPATSCHMPPEWHPHERTLMISPCRVGIWENGLDAATRAYAAVAQAIARFEPVTVAVHPDALTDARAIYGPTVELLPLATDDSWARDTGPTILVDPATGTRRGVHWTFNGYGEKLLPYDRDNTFATRILNHLGIPEILTPLVFEGGGLHVDGAGLAMTTAEAALNPNRNPGLTEDALAAILHPLLGTRKLLCLPFGLADDWDTDGHIDNVAAFVGPGHVLLVAAGQDPGNANDQPLRENLAYLQSETTADGRPLTITLLPQPKPFTDREGRRVCRSYMNFYLVNGGLILPQFDDPADSAAIAVVQKLWPQRQIVPVDARAIVSGGGGIHCITQQIPAV